MIIKYIKDKFYQIATADKSLEKLSLSFCCGNFIAWLPIIPFQTPIIFASAWSLGFNAGVVFIAACLVNNPLTMVPIYLVNYFFGRWFFESLLKINLTCYNPDWLNKLNNYILKYVDFKKYTGAEVFCLWYLILGGILMGLITSLIMYPIIKYAFKKIINKIENSKTKL